jgi:hypothetical protein
MGVDSITQIGRMVLGKEIVSCVQWLDHGIQATVTGGDLSHIGAVSIVDEEGQITTKHFPDHRDYVISERWARKLYKVYSLPVVVTAGIHYDGIDRDAVTKILAVTDEMLEDQIKNCNYIHKNLT